MKISQKNTSSTKSSGLTLVSIEDVQKSISNIHDKAYKALTKEEIDFIKTKFQLRNYYQSNIQYLYLPAFEIVGDKQIAKLVKSICSKGMGHFSTKSGCSIQSIKYFNQF